MNRANEKIYSMASITNEGNTIALTLRLDADAAYRWYSGGSDVEVSGNSIEEAEDNLYLAYMRGWGLKFAERSEPITAGPRGNPVYVDAIDEGDGPRKLSVPMQRL